MIVCASFAMSRTHHYEKENPDETAPFRDREPRPNVAPRTLQSAIGMA